MKNEMNMPLEEPECNKCPQCGEDHITYTGDGFECGRIDVMCMECDARWYEVWRHCYIEMITGVDNR
jgi:hypothetical protein